jgi:hypothetical protein
MSGILEIRDTHLARTHLFKRIHLHTPSSLTIIVMINLSPASGLRDYSGNTAMS